MLVNKSKYQSSIGIWGKTFGFCPSALGDMGCIENF
jgi:hypothetical protein